MGQKILVGRHEGELIFIEMNIDKNYFSMTGDSYYAEPFTYDEVLKHQRASLDDSGIWEDAVARGATRMGADEYYEQYDDDFMLEDYLYTCVNGDEYYFEFSSCGQIQNYIDPEKFDVLLTSMDDLTTILDVWEKYHLKKKEDVPVEIIDAMNVIFEKYQNEDEDLAIYTLAIRNA